MLIILTACPPSIKILNNFNDTPVIKLDDQYSFEQHQLNDYKINSCVWSTQIEDPARYVTKSRGIEVASEDGYARLVLEPNLFIFRVEYLQLIPQKAPTFVQKEGSLASDSSAAFNFTKDFLQKYQIPSKDKSKGFVKLQYDYVQISKTYSIYKYPSRWMLPLYLAWTIYI